MLISTLSIVLRMVITKQNYFGIFTHPNEKYTYRLIQYSAQ